MLCLGFVRIGLSGTVQKRQAKLAVRLALGNKKRRLLAFFKELYSLDCCDVLESSFD